MRGVRTMKAKIYTLVGVGMASLGVLAAAVIAAGYQTDRMDREVSAVYRAAQESYVLQSELQRLQRQEDAMRGSLDLSSQEGAKQYLQSAAALAATQQQRLKGISSLNSSQALSELDALEGELRGYEALQAELISNISKINGVTTDMVYTASSFENAVRVNDELGLLSRMLQLRQLEKEFLWKRDDGIEESFQEAASALVNELRLSNTLLEAERGILLRNAEAYDGAFRDLMSLIKAQQKLSQQSSEAHSRVQEHSGTLITLLKKESDLITYEKANLKQRLNIWLILLSLLSLTALCVIGLLLTRSIVRGVSRLKDGASAIGGGDLTYRVELRDRGELGQLANAFNDMAQKVAASFGKVTVVSEQLAASTGEMYGAFVQTASHAEYTVQSIRHSDRGIEEQRSSLKESVIRLKEMNERLEKAKRASEDIQDLLLRSDEAGRSGLKHAVALSGTHEAHREIIDQLLKDIEETVAGAGEIMRLVSVIGDIADFTRLIALNATIEAARVGEQGRGFAVVAKEIGQLADQTQSRLKEMNGTTTRMRGTIVRLSERAMLLKASSAEEGEAVTQAESSFRDMSGLTNEIVTEVSEIRESVSELSRASAQLSAAVERADEISVQSSEAFCGMIDASDEQKLALAAMERVTGELNGLAERLIKETEQFKLS
jgi:methyl-accepting chemotaxis protein